MVTGYVYFIHAPAVCRVKIGYATDPDRRFRGLQTSSPVPLFLLGVIAGDTRSEVRHHRRFASLRVIGEWFRAEPELMDYVRESALSLDELREREARIDRRLKLREARECAEARANYQARIAAETERYGRIHAWAESQPVSLYGETRSIAEWVKKHQLNISDVLHLLRIGRSPLAALRPPSWMVASGWVARDSRRLPEIEEPADFEIPDF